MQKLIFALRGTDGYVNGAAFANEDLAQVSQHATALSLEGSSVDDQGILSLPLLRELRCLDLDSTQVTDRSLVSLTRLPKLEELWLEGTKVTDAGLDTLRAAKALRFVSVAYTAVSPDGAAGLANAIPGIEVSL
jgi:hypothetical protein